MGPTPMYLGSTPWGCAQAAISIMLDPEHTNDCASNPFRQDLHALSSCPFPCRKDAQRSTVTDAAGITCCSVIAPIRKHRFQSSKGLHGHPRTDSVVYRDDRSAYFDWNDLLCKCTFRESLPRLECKKIMSVNKIGQVPGWLWCAKSAHTHPASCAKPCMSVQPIRRSNP